MAYNKLYNASELGLTWSGPSHTGSAQGILGSGDSANKLYNALCQQQYAPTPTTIGMKLQNDIEYLETSIKEKKALYAKLEKGGLLEMEEGKFNSLIW